MKGKNIAKGAQGETQALNYLKKQKYKILFVNYRNKIGEIDIIGEDKNILAFIEVKARETLVYGRPCEAVDWKKQQKIKNVAQLFLIENKIFDKVPVRFDVVEILGEEISLIKNAF